MKITSATQEELGLLIHGLRSMVVMDQIKVQKRLLKQLEHELSERYGARLADPAERYRTHKPTDDQIQAMGKRLGFKVKKT